jgi:hypothetical protein
MRKDRRFKIMRTGCSVAIQQIMYFFYSKQNRLGVEKDMQYPSHPAYDTKKN